MSISRTFLVRYPCPCLLPKLTSPRCGHTRLPFSSVPEYSFPGDFAPVAGVVELPPPASSPQLGTSPPAFVGFICRSSPLRWGTIPTLPLLQKDSLNPSPYRSSPVFRISVRPPTLRALLLFFFSPFRFPKRSPRFLLHFSFPHTFLRRKSLLRDGGDCVVPFSAVFSISFVSFFLRARSCPFPSAGFF